MVSVAGPGHLGGKIYRDRLQGRGGATEIEVHRVAKVHGYAPGAVAVAWTLRDSAVTAAIVGARRAEQVDDVVAGAEVYLTQSDVVEIEAVTDLAGRNQ